MIIKEVETMSETEKRVAQNNNFDYIIKEILAAPRLLERSTSGIWTYEKWSDGTAKCWCEKNFVSVNIDVMWGNVFQNNANDNLSADFPEGLFIEAPSVFSSPKNTDAWLRSDWSHPTTDKNTGGIIFMRANSAIADVLCDIYAIGRWKEEEE